MINDAFGSQEELVKKAFSAPSGKEIDEEFAAEKRAIEELEDEVPKLKKDKGPQTTSGWGSWAGQGAPEPTKRRLPPKLQPPPLKKQTKRQRTDAKRPNVIISEKRIKRTADAYMLAEIPYPFSSREEYERSMAGGVGKEWNVSSSVKDLTRPAIITRPGKIIQPLSKKVKRQRPAAKF